MKGPPSPVGGAPAGSVALLDVSLIARSRLSRPLPVCADVPAASADSASRLTMTPFELALTDEAFSSAAAPATSAAAADVPLTRPYRPPVWVVRMFSPGAAMKTSGPVFEKL